MNNHESLGILDNREQELEIVERFIKERASTNEHLQILEAGCGRSWPYRLEGVRYTLTGVDKDVDALKIRKETFADLDIEIEGDLRSIDLGEERFDVIYCSYVLEHIGNADLVVRNFIKWSKPNGIIIIKVPDPQSVKGFITRITPHWFHVLFYRLVLRKKNAGRPGYGPYETFYSPVISRNGMHKFCENESNGVTLVAEYGDGHAKPGRGIMKTLLFVLRMLVSKISFGTLSYKHANLLYVLKKQKA